MTNRADPGPRLVFGVRCRGSSHVVGAVRTVVPSTCIGSSRLGGQFLDLGSDRAERTQFVLLCGKFVRIWAVWTVDRLLQTDRIILLKLRLPRPILAHNESRNVIGLVVRQQRRVEARAQPHVVQSISCGSEKAAHSGAIVVTV